MSLLDEFARPRRRHPFDERPDPFGRLPEFLPVPDERPTFDDPLALVEPVGLDGRNRREDVARIEALLGRAGYLDLGETDGPTGFFGLRLDQAIRKFQKEHGLRVDGTILPGGETIGGLAKSVEHSGPNEEKKRSDPQQRLAAAAAPGVLPFIPPLIGALGTILQRVIPPGGGRPDPRDTPEKEKCEE